MSTQLATTNRHDQPNTQIQTLNIQLANERRTRRQWRTVAMATLAALVVAQWHESIDFWTGLASFIN